MEKKPLLTVENLSKGFVIGERWSLFKRVKEIAHAVVDVNFNIYEQETFALVGESGCGKSTTGKLILRLIEPDRGKIIFMNKDITKLKGNDLKEIRRYLQVIFQDPYNSLNPRFTIRQILEEPLIVHNIARNKKEREIRIKELLEHVGMNTDILDRYPHEFSGGQRQRICIARALSLSPRLIVADEPLSALDVSIQAQIILLLKQLQNEFGVSYLFISHDLRVVEYMAHRIAVMYLGHILEKGYTEQIFSNPLHPYTKALLSAIPQPVPGRKGKKILLKGEPSSNIILPQGCIFHPRCREAMPKCKIEKPEWKEIEKGHFTMCHLY